jgi:hypothetical protein
LFQLPPQISSLSELHGVVQFASFGEPLPSVLPAKHCP